MTLEDFIKATLCKSGIQEATGVQVTFKDGTVAGTGVMQVSHKVLGILAGAVYDKNEWIALLVGTRSVDGLDITVTDLRVPLQTRSYASCELARPEPLASDVVGVIHSHHNMGAFFSQTDHDTLNTRFPSSLVVAQVKHSSSDIERLLGFSYKAEGRASLPCGSPGVVNFTVVPMPVVSDWPIVINMPHFAEPNIQVDLSECPHKQRVTMSLVSSCDTACGIHITEPAVAVFGKNDKTFMAEVVEKTEKSKYPQFQPGWNRQDRLPHFTGNNYPGMPVVDNRVPWNRSHGPFEDDDMYDERYLKHWGV